MIFWIFAAILTAGVTAVVLFPLARARAARSGTAAHDAAVYRDQLAELDRDLASGNVRPDEAEEARAEVGRRLLKAAAEERATGAQGAAIPRMRRAASAVVVVLVPAVALGCYLWLGNPGLPSQPLSAREAGPNGNPQLADLVEKAEDHLRANPDDGRGWDVLAPIYFRTGRIQDAEIAYGNAIRLLGSTAKREAGLGEALVMENRGQVTKRAAEAFRRALKMQPGNPRARFYMARGLAQDGKTQEALRAFRSLEAEGEPDASWLPAVRRQIAELGGSPGRTGTGPSAPLTASVEDNAGATPPGNPTAEQMAAAGKMSKADRMTMIRGMVSRLDRELSSKPDNLAGWKRLVRSYVMLGEPDKAKNALGRALDAFPKQSDGGRELIALADNLGVRAGSSVPGEATQ